MARLDIDGHPDAIVKSGRPVLGRSQLRTRLSTLSNVTKTKALVTLVELFYLEKYREEYTYQEQSCNSRTVTIIVVTT